MGTALFGVLIVTGGSLTLERVTLNRRSPGGASGAVDGESAQHGCGTGIRGCPFGSRMSIRRNLWRPAPVAVRWAGLDRL